MLRGILNIIHFVVPNYITATIFQNFGLLYGYILLGTSLFPGEFSFFPLRERLDSVRVISLFKMSSVFRVENIVPRVLDMGRVRNTE